jgi:hypothetical protein
MLPCLHSLLRYPKEHIMASVKPVKHVLKHLEAWSRPEKQRLDFPLGLLGARAWVEYQPKGVVGNILPWNFPVTLTFAPLANVLAAGNRAMIKEHNQEPRPFIWQANPDKIIAAVRRGHQTLESIRWGNIGRGSHSPGHSFVLIGPPRVSAAR